MARRFTVRIYWNKAGAGYPMDYSGEYQAGSPSSAVSAALKDAKKKYGRRYRIQDGAVFEVRIVCGPTIERGGEDDA